VDVVWGLADAARECKTVIDLMEEAFPGGMPSSWGDTKVARLVNKVFVSPAACSRGFD
jgi:hypothetical protein